jgi:hypothetical protein
MSPLRGWQTGRSDHPFLRWLSLLVRGMSLFGLPAPASVMNPPQKDRACRNVIKGNENAFPSSVKSADHSAFSLAAVGRKINVEQFSRFLGGV